MKYDGGGAFPALLSVAAMIPPGTQVTQTIMEPGMTLRDYFAAQALAPLITISDQDMRERRLDSVLAYAKDAAVVAYTFADMMLAERAK